MMFPPEKTLEEQIKERMGELFPKGLTPEQWMEVLKTLQDVDLLIVEDEPNQDLQKPQE